MKKILPWLKANLISVISVTLALIAAPVMIFFASGWSASIRKGVETDVSQNLQQLSALDVTYSIKPYLAGQAPIDVKAPPNKATIQAVSALLAGVVGQSKAVREKAIEFNKAGRGLLIAGDSPQETLFPDQPDESTRLRLLARFAERFPKAHDELLKQFRAGWPPASSAVIASLNDLKAKEVARRTTGRSEKDLTPEDAKALAEQLSDTRVELYRRAAGDMSFYAETAAFKSIPTWDPLKVLPLETAWDWQMLLWVHHDIVAALANANKDPATGLWRPVYRAPIKILESVSVTKPGEKSASQGGATGSGGQPAPAGSGGGDESAELPQDLTQTHTGRNAAPLAPNAFFDIRYADVVAIVASKDLPRVLASFGMTNFMTVTGLKLDEIEALPLLAKGFDCGPDHLVRATIRVETIWLRAWTKPWMPQAVRQSLGIPDDPAPAAVPAAAPTDETPSPPTS